MLVWSSEVPSFASPDDVTLGQSGPFYLEFNEVLDICVITCYIIIMQQYLLKSEDFNDYEHTRHLYFVTECIASAL